jgi:hypothetical protein
MAAAQAIAVPITPRLLVLTVGLEGGGAGDGVGFSNSLFLNSFGACSPSTIQGHNIFVLSSYSIYDLNLLMESGTVAAVRDYFTGILVQDGGSVFRWYPTSAATFIANPAEWRWGNGSNRVWTSAANGLGRQVWLV